jgi:hypothetical protein
MIPLNKPKEIAKLFKIMAIGTGISFILLFLHSSLNDYLYPTLEFQQEIRGRIMSVTPYQSISKIQMDNGIKFRFPTARNYLYDPYDLNEFLKDGDFVEKKINNDTLLIKRSDDEIFIFVLGKDINQK